MRLQVVVMVAVSAVLLAAATALLLRLRAATSDRQVYAYRMVGIMLASAGVVLGMSAGAMWSWSRAQ